MFVKFVYDADTQGFVFCRWNQVLKIVLTSCSRHLVSYKFAGAFCGLTAVFPTPSVPCNSIAVLLLLIHGIGEHSVYHNDAGHQFGIMGETYARNKAQDPDEFGFVRELVSEGESEGVDGVSLKE